MTTASHWRSAIPTYLMISSKYCVVTSAPPLAAVAATSLLTSLRSHRLVINRTGIELSFIFGAIFFLLAFLSALMDDIQRNWKAEEPAIAWDPSLLWRNFLYLGAMFFFIAAFLAYHQGAWLTFLFLAFSIASLITAKKCF